MLNLFLAGIRIDDANKVINPLTSGAHIRARILESGLLLRSDSLACYKGALRENPEATTK